MTDRDRHLQQRWRRRQERQNKAKNQVPAKKGEQNKSIIQSMDEALKEAIRRSLEESFPQKDVTEKVEEKPQNQTEDTTQSTEEVKTVEEKVVSRTPSDIVPEEQSEEKSVDDKQEVDVESISKMTDAEDLKLEAEVSPSVATNETLVEESNEKTHSKNNSREFSFTEGAEDEVAVAIGETLDKCADAIDALGLTSSHSISSSFTEVTTQILSKDSESNEVILPAVEDDIIVEGSDAASIKSEDDWQCVENVNDDFAKAAHLLGSAMFQSDIASPSEELDDSFTSDMTSIPTLSSEISQVLLDRWENELFQLHELGFLNDHVNVNALEHLEAANIGCSSTDEITVNAAVEHILKNKNN